MRVPLTQMLVLLLPCAASGIGAPTIICGNCNYDHCSLGNLPATSCLGAFYPEQDEKCYLISDGFMQSVSAPVTKPPVKCPAGMFSCWMKDAACSTKYEQPSPFYENYYLPIDYTYTGGEPCAFPSRSPLGLLLGNKPPRSGDPEIEAALDYQCQMPPYFFLASGIVRGPKEELTLDLLKDSYYTCGANLTLDSPNVITIFHVVPQPQNAINTWLSRCGEVYYNRPAFDWLSLYESTFSCVSDNYFCDGDGNFDWVNYLPYTLFITRTHFWHKSQVSNRGQALATFRPFADALGTELAQRNDQIGNLAAQTLISLVHEMESGTIASQYNSAVRQVPPFSQEYLKQQLPVYLQQFQAMTDQMESVQEQVALLKVMGASLTAEKQVLVGQSSVLDVAANQISDEITLALNSMTDAINGQKRVEDKIGEVQKEFKKAVEQYLVQQIVSMAVGLVTNAASMASEAYAAANTVEEAVEDAEEEATTAEGEIETIEETTEDAEETTSAMKGFNSAIKFFKVVAKLKIANIALSIYGIVQTFGTISPQSGCCCYEKSSECADTYATSDCQNVRSKTPVPSSYCALAYPLSQLVEAAMNVADISDAPGVSNGDTTTEGVSNQVKSLSTDIAQMGTGYWQEYVADGSGTYDQFLTGKTGGDSAAGYAKQIIQYLQAQADYGNDWTAAAAKYVSGMQQLQLNQAQKNANAASLSATQQALDLDNQEFIETQYQEQVLAMQITSVAQNMDVMLSLVCQGLAYQNTRQYFYCLDEPGSSIEALCQAYEVNNGSTFVPFIFSTNNTQISTAGQTAYQYLNEYQSRYNTYAQVMNAVETQLFQTAEPAASTLLSLTAFESNQTLLSPNTNTTQTLLCDTTVPGADYIPMPPTACGYENANQIPPHLTCCNLTVVTAVVTNTEAPDRPSVSLFDWEQFKNASSSKHGTLTFRISPYDSAWAPTLTTLRDFSGTYLRGFFAYASGAKTKLNNDIVRVSLEPSGNSLQRYNDCKSGSNQDECWQNFVFQAPQSPTHILVPSTFEYDPIASASASCGSLNGKSPVFSTDTPVCGEVETEGFCPDPNQPPYYCIEPAILQQGGANYFGQTNVPGYGDITAAFNFPSLYTAWTLRFTSANTGTSEGLDLSEVEGVLFQFYFLGLKEDPTRPPICDVQAVPPECRCPKGLVHCAKSKLHFFRRRNRRRLLFGSLPRCDPEDCCPMNLRA